MVDVDKVVMYPNVAHTLMAYAVTVNERGESDTDLSLHVAPAEPFLVAAAKARAFDAASNGRDSRATDDSSRSAASTGRRWASNMRAASSMWPSAT